MREILFRGKTKGNVTIKDGLFVFGLPFYENGVVCGIETIDGKLYRVDPETIVQYTGLKDKNGKKIFEGDIHENVHNGLLFVACFGAYFDTEYKIDVYGWYWKCPSNGHISGFSGYEHCYANIIGNVHDNPELLEGNND